ncbi:ankyrin repeat domain-containing protein [Streptomyces sp. R21]|uniref:Ankyrin repeat domain-containing protein n=1 Tax=Streptomyces sp. R21 TaxID=3238627 RepID=A0AB39P3G7_9ACTN
MTSDAELVAAVRSGNAARVKAAVDADADPDAVDEHGTPVLCLAVDTLDPAVVEELAWCARIDGADPDGRTPLLRAVDRGAFDIMAVLVAKGAHLWIKDAEGRDALALARYWHETGAVTELRRRTGLTEPVRRTSLRDEDGCIREELALGALTIRTGHAAILTYLEPKYGIRPPFEELLARALAEPDVDHEVWWTTTGILQQRHDPLVWQASAALCARADPRERCFGAEVLRAIHLFDESEDDPFEGPLVDLFLDRAAEERDPRVMRVLTAGLSDTIDPRRVDTLVTLAGHDDGRVRERAVYGLAEPVASADAPSLAVVLARTRDAVADVRRAACLTLCEAPTNLPAPSDALAARLEDEDEAVRVTAATRLVLRDDPRGDELLGAYVGTAEDSPHYWRLYEAWHHDRPTG